MATKPAEINTGENVRYAVEGDELVIRIDLTHRASDAPLPGKKTIRAEFNSTADIPSQDRTIKVRIWHDTEVHRLEVIES